MLNVKSIADYLGISVSLVRKMVRNKEVPYNKLGSKIVFSKAEIDKWLKANQINKERNNL